MNADTGAILRELGEHLHGENAVKVEVAEVLTTLKRRAEETIEGTAQVVNESVQNLSQAAQGQMPNLSSLKKMVHRKRNNVAGTPPVPQSLLELQIPDAYQQYEMEPGQFKLFPLADTGRDAQRILLFGREANPDTLEQ